MVRHMVSLVLLSILKEGKSPTRTNVCRLTLTDSLSYHHDYMSGIVYIYIVTYTSRAKRSEPSAHMDQRCFVGVLLYADFAFECHSRSRCSLVQFIGSHPSLKPSWAERDRPFILFRCLPAAWSTCRMLWDVCHGVCCLFSCIFPVSICFGFFSSSVNQKKVFVDFSDSSNATDHFSINKWSIPWLK